MKESTVGKFRRTVHLVAELFERGRALLQSVLGMRLDLLGGEHVVVEQELSHELVSVVAPQIRVGVERGSVLGGTVHHQIHVLHYLGSHV